MSADAVKMEDNPGFRQELAYFDFFYSGFQSFDDNFFYYDLGDFVTFVDVVFLYSLAQGHYLLYTYPPLAEYYLPQENEDEDVHTDHKWFREDSR